MAVGAGGEARIQWALGRVEARIKAAAARANNQANKIRSINIAVFGFSRGAATARAFARRIADRCAEVGERWEWKEGRHPTRLYFLGLFDTVASVGLPASARKFGGEAFLLGFLPVLIAANADGHGGWAENLRVPPMVERCVHYCSAHEMRNSFPLDTLLEDGVYPENCFEHFYPGVHSNVGGGYRPGEGGRNTNRFAMLNLIPLKAMYEEAIKAGVPLVDINTADDQIKDDFLPPPGEATEARKRLSEHFDYYMNTVGWGGNNVGETVRRHMQMYFRWRIQHVQRKMEERQKGGADWETQRLVQYDSELETERREKQEELRRREREYRAAQSERDRVRTEADQGYWRADADEVHARYEEKRWAKVHQEAVVNTMPANADQLAAALDKYDQQFLQDSKAVLAADPSTLRPFARILREAWEMERLTDKTIIAFFDEYVTDSLAGFDTDRTRAIEHRWLYQGGDATIDYAALRRMELERLAEVA